MRKVGKIAEAPPVADAGESRQNSAKKAKRRVSGENLPQTRIPNIGEASTAGDDEKQVHVKDRDLDIL